MRSSSATRPTTSRSYAVAQIVEHGGGGSAVAAPIARDILLYALCGGLPPLEAYPADQRKAIEEQRARRRPPRGAGEGPGMSALRRHRRAARRGASRSCSRSTGRWCCSSVAVACTGFLMLYSVAGGDTEPWAGPQMLRFGVGMVAMIGIAMVDIRFWRMMAPLAYAGSLALLVLVEVMGEIGMGAQRWIDLGPVQLQPSELMKVSLVMVLAAYYHRLDPAKVSRPLWLVLPLVLTAIPVALVLTQPDLGTAILLLAGAGAVMFLAGVSLWYFAAAIAGGVGLVAAVIELHGTDWQLIKEYQFARIFTFLDPDADPLGAGYHITQAKIALGSGGLSGRGFMQGTQARLNFLPEKHTDFIFTTLAEEFGFMGSMALLRALRADRGLLRRLGDLQPRPVRRALDRRHRHDLLPALRGQHGHGDGNDAGGRRAAALRLLRRLGDADAARGLRAGAERPCPPPTQPRD